MEWCKKLRGFNFTKHSQEYKNLGSNFLIAKKEREEKSNMGIKDCNFYANQTCCEHTYIGFKV